MAESKLFEGELHDAMQQLFDETVEAMQLAKQSPDLDDLAAVFAVALLKLGLATGFVEQRHPGFAKAVEEDPNGESNWTPFNPRIGRKIYKVAKAAK